MSKIKGRLKEALAETELGSGLLVDEKTLDAAAEHLTPLVLDAKASALFSMAWQLPPTIGNTETREQFKRHLIEVSEKVRAGGWWEQ